MKINVPQLVKKIKIEIIKNIYVVLNEIVFFDWIKLVCKYIILFPNYFLTICFSCLFCVGNAFFLYRKTSSRRLYFRVGNFAAKVNEKANKVFLHGLNINLLNHIFSNGKTYFSFSQIFRIFGFYLEANSNEKNYRMCA